MQFIRLQILPSVRTDNAAHLGQTRAKLAPDIAANLLGAQGDPGGNNSLEKEQGAPHRRVIQQLNKKTADDAAPVPSAQSEPGPRR